MKTIAIALDDRLGNFSLKVDFELPMHGISALFGPSGCGKTTILRAMAGLNRLKGTIRVGDETWQDGARFVPTHRRALGYVFQEASLFPHLSVRQNLAYGQRRAGGNAAIGFDEIVDLLGIGHLIDRSPANLSGGERQRVSIGRALLSQPRLLLMDEPLSALDRMAKDEILPYFEALHGRIRIPIVLVTHDITEVERLADHLVLLREGRVEACGALQDVLSAPQSVLAARRDFASILPARVVRFEAPGLAVLDLGGCHLMVPADGLKPDDRVRVRIAAGDVSIALTRAQDTSILNAVAATVTDIDMISEAEAGIRLHLGTTAKPIIRARITRRSAQMLALAPGKQVIAQIKGVSLAASR